MLNYIAKIVQFMLTSKLFGVRTIVLAVIFQCFSDDGRRQKRVDRNMIANAMTYFRAADIVKRSVDKTHCGRKRNRVDVGVSSRINDDGIMSDDVVGVIPTGEREPIVGSDEKCEHAIGIVVAHRLECMPHIRRLRQMKFTIVGDEMRLICKSQTNQFEA